MDCAKLRPELLRVSGVSRTRTARVPAVYRTMRTPLFGLAIAPAIIRGNMFHLPEMCRCPSAVRTRVAKMRCLHRGELPS